MQPNNNRIPFVSFTFEEAFLATPWTYLFEKQQPQTPGEKEFYSCNLLVNTKHPEVQRLQKLLSEYKANGNYGRYSKPVLRDLEEAGAKEEAEYMLMKGKSLENYAILKMKNRADDPSRAPTLAAPNGQRIVRCEANRRFFKRGTQVNVKCVLGVNKAQPYFIFHGVQYVSPGFSDSLPETVTAEFNVINRNNPAGMQTEVTFTDDAPAGAGAAFTVAADCTNEPNF